MRGEEAGLMIGGGANVELPPHARRRATGVIQAQTVEGITSACAEKSYPARCRGWRQRNYLRMRGEELLLEVAP